MEIESYQIWRWIKSIFPPKVSLLATIAGAYCFIEIEIVKISLLLLKLHLKTKAVTDIVHDKITTIDKRIDLYFSTRRHYWIDIYPNKTEKEKHEKVLILQDLTKKEKIANYQNK